MPQLSLEMRAVERRPAESYTGACQSFGIWSGVFRIPGTTDIDERRELEALASPFRRHNRYARFN